MPGIGLFVTLFIGLGVMRALPAAEFTSPDIFVLGDSQVTFGAGEPWVDLLEDIDQRCAAHWQPATLQRRHGEMSVGVMGIRSSSVHALTARSGRSRALICEKDRKWGVNAGSYGVLRDPQRRFEQVGEHPHNQFCDEGLSPLEAMFRDGYYAPRLLVMFFLGNSAQRWAEAPDLVQADVRRLSAQLPADLPCVFVTTAPTYRAETNAQRTAGQDAFARALHDAGGRCEFVAGLTPATVAEFQGNKRYYYKKKSGEVRDPYHVNKSGARRFLALRSEAICTAIERAGEPTPALAEGPR